MRASDDRVEEIKDRLITARATEDTEGIVRGLYDLEDIDWKKVSVVSRYIGINGERLELQTWLHGGMQVIALRTSRAFRLIWLLRFRDMINKGHHRWVKHENDMSPEEYEWLHNE